jgi:hypothetical protein
VRRRPAWQNERRELVTAALAGARRHEGEHVAAIQDGLEHLALAGAEVLDTDALLRLGV